MDDSVSAGVGDFIYICSNPYCGKRYSPTSSGFHCSCGATLNMVHTTLQPGVGVRARRTHGKIPGAGTHRPFY